MVMFLVWFLVIFLTSYIIKVRDLEKFYKHTLREFMNKHLKLWSLKEVVNINHCGHH